MAVHFIEPIPENLHGTFSRDYEPILTIEPGDTVVLRTLDASWQIKNRTSLADEPEYLPDVVDPEKRSDGHCLCGPIAIRGALPGMTLEVQIDEVRCGTWGWTNSGGWPHWILRALEVDGRDARLFWNLDAESDIGRNQLGHEVKLRPFMGVMGMPPDEPGRHSTVPPRRTGGNLDCKELIAGTRLFLPIEVAGGLFSVGDGHAAQGDGEVCVTAIECPMERVGLTFHLHPKPISGPRARAQDAWITFGLHEDLDQACILAINSMLELMQELHPELDRSTCLGLASVAVDVRVTQLVNEVKGAHAILRDDAIRFEQPVS
jgi:acetamidase/formamidase